MTANRRVLLIVGLMLSLFLASMESTVIATAMPTIVGDLGGLDRYSWAFSIYLLASTTTVPLFGKLSDVYGRTSTYLTAMGLFLVGSLLCGFAQSMNQLIGFRAVQGIGAGGLLPLTFIIIGDSFTIAERTRVQGFFSSVWGVSSIAGPLLGGFLVDAVAWPWVFFVNLVPGGFAALLVWSVLKGRRPSGLRPRVDYAGAALLTGGLIALLLGLFALGTPPGWLLLGLALLLFVGLVLIERRAADPIVPLALFRERLFSVACLHGLLAGCALFGSTAFVPLFVQASAGTSATVAGATLTPMLLAWVGTSIVSSRLLLRVNYRSLALTGMVLLTLGSLLLWRLTGTGRPTGLVLSTALMGSGMGLSIPAFLIAVQSSVSRTVLGAATSSLQFSRSIGGTIGVSVMGVVLSSRLAAALTAAGLDPTSITLDRLLDPMQHGTSPSDTALRSALVEGMAGVFLIALIAAAAGLIATALAPGGNVTQLSPPETRAAADPKEGTTKPRRDDTLPVQH